MSNIKFAILNIKKNFQNAKELNSAFITTIIGMFINDIAFVVLWFNFGKIVGNLNGWDAFDIFGLYGFSTMSFGIVNTFFYGIYNIPKYISSGNFDNFLLTPKNILMKVATSSISTSALGDALFGLICLGIYGVESKLVLSQFMILILLIISSSIIFFAFTLICMSISFYLMEGENISDGLYLTFITPSLYHGGAFTGVLKIIFTFLIPSLLIGAIPVEIVKNIDLLSLSFIIVFTIFWFLLSILFFYKSLKKYESNNFFGFGG